MNWFWPSWYGLVPRFPGSICAGITNAVIASAFPFWFCGPSPRPGVEVDGAARRIALGEQPLDVDGFELRDLDRARRARRESAGESGHVAEPGIELDVVEVDGRLRAAVHREQITLAGSVRAADPRLVVGEAGVEQAAQLVLVVGVGVRERVDRTPTGGRTTACRTMTPFGMNSQRPVSFTGTPVMPIVSVVVVARVVADAGGAGPVCRR